MIIRNSKTVKELIRFHDLDAQQMHSHSIEIANIHECRSVFNEYNRCKRN